MVGNSLVGQPSEAAESEELPVVGAHPNVLDGLVDELRFDCEGSACLLSDETTSEEELTLIVG